MKPTLNLIVLKQHPIYLQLQLEEALLRADQGNWCLINQGSPPAIIVGISGKAELLVDHHKAKQLDIPLIRRFSGGGTVVVDHDTLFSTFICNSTEITVPCYPEKILRWTEKLYSQTFSGLDFNLNEQDYILGNRKCGGNAQYLQKDRWLHHTSFLWNYCSDRMSALLQPLKTPKYRANRPHEDFVCKIKNYLPDQDDWLLNFKKALENYFEVCQVTLDIAEAALLRPHRRSTQWIAKE